MTLVSTHDTKRSEDVRARITVLSQCADRWAQRVRRWNTVCLPPDEGTGLFLWQNMFGVWPASGEVSDQHRRTRRRDSRHVVVLGDPVSRVSKPVGRLCQQRRSGDRIGGALVGAHSNEIEDRKTH